MPELGWREAITRVLQGRFDPMHYTAIAEAIAQQGLRTEFGATPLFTIEELRAADVALALYPLSAFRAANKAAENVYTAIRRDGSQQQVVDTMQTRKELYDRIDYYAYEDKLDALFASQKK